MADYDFQSLVVLPAIRLSRLRQAVDDICDDYATVQAIMAAVEEHIEVGAYRWGNACPECHDRLHSKDGDLICPNHGHLGLMAATELLVAFKPSEPT